LLCPQELLSIIPELEISDLVGGLYCDEDGYLDPYSVMQAYRENAQALGVEYISGEIVSLMTEKDRITGVNLAELPVSQHSSSPRLSGLCLVCCSLI